MAYHFDIFISSTKTDLDDFRAVANEAIRNAGMFPIDMANFQPEAGNALQVCYDAVQQAEAFIGIYAHKYGYCPDATVTYVDKDGNTRAGDGVTSITEWEYKWAIEKGIPIMLFLINPDTAWKPSLIEKGAGAQGLNKFKAHIGKNHIVKFFETLADFEKVLPFALLRAYKELSDIELDRMARAPRSREQIEADEKRILSVANTPKPKYTGKIRFINPLPKIFGKDDFFDRVDHQAQATNLLTERKAMVSIYGKGGIGKTALACKVLNDFATSNHEVGLAVFRMDDSPRPSAEFILLALAQFLPDEHPAHDTLKQPAISIRDKTVALINGLAGGQYILYLDNFESIQHPDSHHIADEYIEAMVTAILERGGGVLQLLITSRYPIPFEARLKALEKVVRVDEGLGNEDAIAFMREMDGDNHALPDEDALLGDFIHRTGGYPRALEALVGYLGQSVTHHIEDFTDNPDVWHGEVMSNIVDKIHNTLPDSFRKVVGAIAIIGQTSTQEELEYALAPFIEISAIRHILARLAEGRFVVYNRQTRTYGLHHYDLRYATESVPIGSKSDMPYTKLAKYRERQKGRKVENPTTLPFTQYVINYSMAQFYNSKRKPESQWEQLEDLMPQLREINFRKSIQDYDSIANILHEINTDYLMLWGHSNLVYELNNDLQGKLNNPDFTIYNSNILGLVCLDLGKIDEAIQNFTRGLKLAEIQNNKQAQSAILGNLGLIYSSINDNGTAIDYYKRALVTSQKIKDRYNEGAWLGNLGSVYHNLNRFDEAILYHEKALAISREFEDINGESVDLSNLGTIYFDFGKFDIAKEYYEQALILTRKIGNKRAQSASLDNLGKYHSAIGDIRLAIDYHSQAIAIAKEIGNKRGEIYGLYNLTKQYILLKDFDKATYHLNEAQELKLVINRADLFPHPVKIYWLVGGVFREYLISQIKEMENIKLLDEENIAIYGAIAWCAGHADEAKLAYIEAIRHADDLITKTPKLYDAHYARALAYVGLWLLGDADAYATARDGYVTARGLCDAKGVLLEQKMLLEALLACSDADGSALLALLG